MNVYTSTYYSLIKLSQIDYLFCIFYYDLFIYYLYIARTPPVWIG